MRKLFVLCTLVPFLSGVVIGLTPGVYIATAAVNQTAEFAEVVRRDNLCGRAIALSADYANLQAGVMRGDIDPAILLDENSCRPARLVPGPEALYRTESEPIFVAALGQHTSGL